MSKTLRLDPWLWTFIFLVLCLLACDLMAGRIDSGKEIVLTTASSTVTGTCPAAVGYLEAIRIGILNGSTHTGSVAVYHVPAQTNFPAVLLTSNDVTSATTVKPGVPYYAQGVSGSVTNMGRRLVWDGTYRAVVYCYLTNTFLIEFVTETDQP